MSSCRGAAYGYAEYCLPLIGVCPVRADETRACWWEESRVREDAFTLGPAAGRDKLLLNSIDSTRSQRNEGRFRSTDSSHPSSSHPSQPPRTCSISLRLRAVYELGLQSNIYYFRRALSCLFPLACKAPRQFQADAKAASCDAPWMPRRPFPRPSRPVDFP